MVTETIREKMMKIYRLAQGGTGGEAAAADTALKAMLAKHGMTMADLESTKDALEDHDFMPQTSMEIRLVNQVIYSVCGDTRVTYKRPKMGVTGVTCTRAEAAEIAIRFGVLRVDIVKQYELFFSAYCHTNDLFPPKEKRRGEAGDASPEEIERLRRMMGGIDKTAIHKQIKG